MAEVVYRKIGKPDFMYQLHKLAKSRVISEDSLGEIAQREIEFLFSVGLTFQRQHNIIQSYIAEGDYANARLWDSTPSGLIESMEEAYGSRLQEGDLRNVGKKYIQRELRIQQRRERHIPSPEEELEMGRHAILKLRDWVIQEFYPYSKGGVEHIVDYCVGR